MRITLLLCACWVVVLGEKCHFNDIQTVAGVLVSFILSALGKTELKDNSNYSWDIELITSNNTVFNLNNQEGKVRVLSFFFTQCRTMCPVQTAKLAKVQRRLSSRSIEQSDFVSISIDPVVDTLGRISEYEQRYRINKDHWRFVKTNDFVSLNHLLDRLAINVKPNKEIGELDHRMLIFLINPQGTIVQQYIGSQFDEQRLVREINTLIDIYSQTPNSST